MKYPFSPEVLDAMPEAMAELYRTLELRLLKEIADRLKAAGQLNEVTVQDIKALRSHGIKLDEIKKAIQETSGIGKEELDKLMDDVVARNEAYYGEMTTLAEVTKPDELVNASDINAIMKQTANEVRNITQSMGFLVDSGRTMLKPAKAYQWALDKAELEISSGAISYNQAIADATRELADSGLMVVDYESGWHDHVDVAVRRAVMTGITQVCDKYTDESAEYLDSPYVEVSAHSGARDKPYPNPWSSHRAWQGKVYYQSKNGESDPLGKYPDLVGETGYGFVDGLCGANCRHRRHIWIEGVSERTYTDAQLANIDPPDFEYQGRTYSHYEATQEQRKLERTIRKWKRREAAAVTPEDKQACQIRILRLRKEYAEFTKKAGLRSQIERANVYQPKAFTDAANTGIISESSNVSAPTNNAVMEKPDVSGAVKAKPDYEPPREKTVADCNTFEEIKTYFGDKYNIKVYDSVGTLDMNGVKIGLSGIEAAINRFPKVVGTVKVIATDRCGFMSSTGRSISFNPTYFGVNKFKSSKEYTFQSGAHELGHCVDMKICDAHESVLKESAGSLWSRNAIARKIISRAIKEFKIENPQYKDWSARALRGSISNYAVDGSTAEALAEAVGNYIWRESQGILPDGNVGRMFEDKIVSIIDEELSKI